MRQNT